MRWPWVAARGAWRACRGSMCDAGAQTKSFFLQRRIDGYLVKETLGPLSVKRARAEAMKSWSGIRPVAPAADGVITLSEAIEQYIDAKGLADSTQRLARYNTDRYLANWKMRTLEAIGREHSATRRRVA